MATRDRKKDHPGARIYRQPVIVLYKLNGQYCAELKHPLKPVPAGAIKTAIEGTHTAIGKWLDLGYTFGEKREIIPEFVKIPEKAEYLFCKSVTHVPITL
jgi:hypothetical protein